MGLNDFIKVGSKIKKIRKSKGISQKYIAEEVLKIPRSTYSNYENDNRVPDKKTLEEIAKALGVEVPDLLEIDEMERVKFEGDFDVNVFSPRVMKYINDLKDNIRNTFPGIEIDNTLIIENTFIDKMAEESARISAGMFKQELMPEFQISGNKVITGEELYDSLYYMYFNKYDQEYKSSLAKKAKLIIDAYADNFDELSDRGISILKEYYKDFQEEDIPMEILKVLNRIKDREG